MLKTASIANFARSFLGGFAANAYISNDERESWTQEVRRMSPKELLYLEDALGHEKFLQDQCREAVSKLTDPELKNYAQQLLSRHQELFNQFFQLI